MVSTRQHRQRRDVSPASASSEPAAATDDNILLVQSIQITDKFGFQAEDGSDAGMNLGGGGGAEPHEKAYAGVAQDKLTCLNGYGMFCSLCENAQSRANQSRLAAWLPPLPPSLTSAPTAAATR